MIPLESDGLPSQAELNRRFRYEWETGYLFHRERNDRDIQWNAQYANKRAGSCCNGYLGTAIHKKKLSVHRIIWKMVYGLIPADLQIDHINGQCDDNRLHNLRLVTGTQNQQNRIASKRHNDEYSDLPKGVYWNKSKGKYKAEITLNGERLYLGQFTDALSAGAVYSQVELILFCEYARRAAA